MPRQAADKTAYSVVGHSHHPWEPGLSKLPYRGLGALVLSVAGVVVAIIVLVVSDGADIKHWRFQPAVYVSIASTVTNITMVYALMEGVSISWWCKAMNDGTSIADLHRIWEYGSSFVAALFCGRHINLIAAASLLVAISPINGPLLQRASTIGPSNVDSTQLLQVEVSKLVPPGFTGITSTRGNNVSMLTGNFSSIARDYYNRAAIPFKSDCIDNCRASVLGAGFHANCSTYQAPFSASGGYNDPFKPTTIFSAALQYQVDYNAVGASLNIQYKPKGGCEGELSVKNCSLSGGTVLYEVIMNGPASTVALAPGTTIWDDIIVGAPDHLPLEDTSGGPSTYGGIFLALGNQFTTNFELQFGGGIGWEYFGTQSEASVSYAHNVTTYPSCDVYFSDPTEDFLQSTRELIFRTAVLSANETNVQHVSAQATGSHTVYHTNYLFVALATASSLIPIISILLTFRGSQRLGREVSLSPIEVAKAFGAPMLRGANSNARASALLKQVGYRPIKYGIVRDTSIRRKPLSHRFSRTPYSDEQRPDRNGDGNATTTPDFVYSNAIPMTSPPQFPDRFSRTPYIDHSSYHNGNQTPDFEFSDTIPPERPQQQPQQQDEWDSVENSHAQDHHPPPLHTPQQSRNTSGFESDLELLDTSQSGAGGESHPRAWLELANPKSVTAIQKGTSFSDW